MVLRYSPISYSMEGSLVPGMEVVKPLFCSIHTPSRQGLLYLLAIEKYLLVNCELDILTLTGKWRYYTELFSVSLKIGKASLLNLE